MNYVGILAGGKGTRMGKIDLPKQFLMLGTKPVIVHTIEQFVLCEEVDQVIVAVPEAWLSYTEDIVEKYLSHLDNVHITAGGADRNGSLMNICTYIEKNYGITEQDILVSHDAVRPFVTDRIIKDNIKGTKEHDAIDTVIPATDTIVESLDGFVISNIPNRNNMYQGQTPQSFKITKLVEVYNSLTDEEKAILTDACKIFTIKGLDVGIVSGEPYNMKITNQFDYKLAGFMVEKGEDTSDK
ncbi:MAG: 2-C-methyl-D-erythritol 4-phosphate cytidylyltransferase [Clostridia bacterium]|nr:2-C-methyl-D-erythritol 4-phosphate cytidylyltransferase [Clostridia bacterium]